jgi:YVTN family beta-propeller protein
LRLAAAALLLASCAGVGQAPAASSAADELVVRTAHDIQVRNAKGDLLRSFGRAVASPDGSVYYALEGAGPSTLGWIEAKTGRALTRLELPGTLSFADEHGPAPSGFSPNGRWLVLVGPSGPSSRFVVVDTGLLKVAADVAVPGAFAYDAISDDGTSLYLIERIDARAAQTLAGVNPAYAYRVRVYDLPSAKLSETLVVDTKLAAQTNGDNAQTRIDGIMNGIYQSSVPSRDGQSNFSFYYNPNRGPFIHVLHLNSRNAFCILDLPIVPNGYDKRLRWSLALAPSGSTLYASNGTLGLVSAIDTTTLKVRYTATVAGLPPVVAGPARTGASSAVSRDGRKLYFPAERGVALVDTNDLSLRGLFLGDRTITSVSLSSDGHRLYALSSDGTITIADANTGRQTGEFTTGDAAALLSVLSP